MMQGLGKSSEFYSIGTGKWLKSYDFSHFPILQGGARLGGILTEPRKTP